MDLKTLEYMEERAKKARKIVDKIERLQSNIDKLEKASKISFHDKNERYLFNSTTCERLTEEMKAAYQHAAENEIDRLKNELAEL